MKLISVPLLTLPILLVSGCMVGPDFHRPDTSSPLHYSEQDDNVSSSAQHIAMGKQLQQQWWTLFASPALNSVIEQAIAHNNTISAAKQTLAQANEYVKAERGGLLPQVSLGATAGRQKYGAALFGPANFSIPPFTYYELGPSFSWSPDLAGGKKRRIEYQQALADYQKQQLDAAYLNLTAQVVQQALTIAATQSTIDLNGKLLATDEKNLQLVQLAFKAGANTRPDVLAAQAQLDADRTRLPALQQQLSVARHALAILVGATPADWLAPSFKLNDFKLPQELPVSLPSQLVHQRPDILAAEANLHAASAAIGVATANLYPQINLSANLLQEALTPSGLFNSVSTAWSLAAGLTAPVYNGGTLTAEKRAAEHGYQAALAQYRQTILQSFADVADTLQGLQHGQQQLDSLQQATDTVQAALDMARKSYQLGNTGVLPVQDATRQLYRVQLDLLDAQNQRLVNTAQLFVSLGGSPVS